jgi:hypothetical protein
MKFTKFLFLAFAAILAFAACNNDDDSSSSGPYLRAKVDGDSYESNTSLLTGQAIFGDVLLTGFESANGTGRSFTLVFEENLAVGAYPYDGSVGNNVAAVYYPGGVGAASYGDISGSFTILEYDSVANSIKGGFNFVGTEAINGDSVNVTEGEFSMTYQQ